MDGVEAFLDDAIMFMVMGYFGVGICYMSQLIQPWDGENATVMGSG